jgi:hypothetical protein
VGVSLLKKRPNNNNTRILATGTVDMGDRKNSRACGLHSTLDFIIHTACIRHIEQDKGVCIGKEKRESGVTFVQTH